LNVGLRETEAENRQKLRIELRHSIRSMLPWRANSIAPACNAYLVGEQWVFFERGKGYVQGAAAQSGRLALRKAI